MASLFCFGKGERINQGCFILVHVRVYSFLYILPRKSKGSHENKHQTQKWDNAALLYCPSHLHNQIPRMITCVADERMNITEHLKWFFFLYMTSQTASSLTNTCIALPIISFARKLSTRSLLWSWSCSSRKLYSIEHVNIRKCVRTIFHP